MLSIGPAHALPAAVHRGVPERRDDHWIERIVLVAPDDHAIPCLLLTPLSEPPWPAAVVAVHQHNNEFALGKSEPAGVEGDPELSYGLGVVRRGIPVVAPDLSGFEERRPESGDPYRAEQLVAWNLVADGRSLQGRHVEDVSLVAGWLGRQLEIGGPIGAVGHSLGGQVVFFAMAADSRLRAGVASCGIGSIASFETADVLHNPAWYVPGLRAAGDAEAVAGCFDGQRVRVVQGRRDPIFPLDGVRSVAASFPDGVCDLVEFDGGHAFPEPIQSQSIEWLVQTLLLETTEIAQ